MLIRIWDRFISSRSSVVVVVAVCTILNLNVQAYTSMMPLPCHRAIERADQFQRRCKIHLLFSYSFTYTSIISKFAHI
ncbi:hypothetical protein PVAP13_6KG215306 [Panicum virgatum]|uniref:Uncharacterized protein n=1 Tax=Panicum virgatum TaxID=38727 RepID=A0A8T0RDJ2_PANVG|nr:hypothetical protein PVAP13_6KG215306 [Panicum virgatum]